MKIEQRVYDSAAEWDLPMGKLAGEPAQSVLLSDDRRWFGIGTASGDNSASCQLHHQLITATTLREA